MDKSRQVKDALAFAKERVASGKWPKDFNFETYIEELLMGKKLDDLEAIIMYMDVPSFRRRNVKWLRKNLKVRNSDHPKYEDAMNLIEELYKQGIHHG